MFTKETDEEYSNEIEGDNNNQLFQVCSNILWIKFSTFQ